MFGRFFRHVFATPNSPHRPHGRRNGGDRRRSWLKRSAGPKRKRGAGCRAGSLVFLFKVEGGGGK